MSDATRPALLRQAAWTALVPGALLFLVLQVTVHVTHGMVGADSHAYWFAARHPDTWYTTPPEHWDAYLYPPLFAQVLWPLAQLPWEAFQVVWAIAQVAVLAWLLVPLGWRRGLTLAPFFVPELLLGNVYLFLAAALVLAVRQRPGALLAPLLTKVSPGVVGLWFVLRGDWRFVRSTVLFVGGVVLVSAAIAPAAWTKWVEFLATSSGSATSGAWLFVRFAAAALLTLAAARRGQAWLLAPALLLACPVLSAFSPLAVLGAVPRLLAWQRAQASDTSPDRLAASSPQPASLVSSTASSASRVSASSALSASSASGSTW